MKTIDEIYEEHLKKEPKVKWKWFDKECGRGITTDAWSSWDFHRRRLKPLVELGREKREEIFKIIKSGLKLGEVVKKTGYSLDIVSDILYYNIQTNKCYAINTESI